MLMSDDQVARLRGEAPLRFAPHGTAGALWADASFWSDDDGWWWSAPEGEVADRWQFGPFASFRDCLRDYFERRPVGVGIPAEEWRRLNYGLPVEGARDGS